MDSTGVLKSDLAPLRFARNDGAPQAVIPSAARDLLFFAAYEEPGFSCYRPTLTSGGGTGLGGPGYAHRVHRLSTFGLRRSITRCANFNSKGKE
jgi:hypothetical protein